MAKQGRKHQFAVYTSCGGRSTPRVIAGDSLEGAALAFIEDVGLAPHADEHEASVYVRDLAGGKEHCFRIDLDTGETSPCT